MWLHLKTCGSRLYAMWCVWLAVDGVFMRSGSAGRGRSDRRGRAGQREVHGREMGEKNVSRFLAPEGLCLLVVRADGLCGGDSFPTRSRQQPEVLSYRFSMKQQISPANKYAKVTHVDKAEPTTGRVFRADVLSLIRVNWPPQRGNAWTTLRTLAGCATHDRPRTWTPQRGRLELFGEYRFSQTA